jgi:hypothetical protein
MLLTQSYEEYKNVYLWMQRMAENDKNVTRYMDDISFQEAILPVLAKEIYKTVLDTAE